LTENYYEVLGVPYYSTRDQIVKAYKKVSEFSI